MSISKAMIERAIDDELLVRVHAPVINEVQVNRVRLRDHIAEHVLEVIFKKKHRDRRQYNRRTAVICEINDAVVEDINAFLDSRELPSGDPTALPPILNRGRSFYNFVDGNRNNITTICMEDRRVRFLSKTWKSERSGIQNFLFEDMEGCHFDSDRFIDPTQPFRTRVAFTARCSPNDDEYDDEIVVEKFSLWGRYSFYELDFVNRVMTYRRRQRVARRDPALPGKIVHFRFRLEPSDTMKITHRNLPYNSFSIDKIINFIDDCFPQLYKYENERTRISRTVSTSLDAPETAFSAEDQDEEDEYGHPLPAQSGLGTTESSTDWP